LSSYIINTDEALYVGVMFSELLNILKRTNKWTDYLRWQCCTLQFALRALYGKMVRQYSL